jgi:hypothetical protein
MHSLDLAGKDAVNVNEDSELGLEDIGQAALIALLDDVERPPEVLVLGHGQEIAQRLGIGEPLVRAKRMRYEVGELGIALQEPSAGSDPVGDIREEVATLELDKVPEDRRLEQLAVKLGHTVDLEGADDGEMANTSVPTESCNSRHANVFRRALFDDGHAADPIHVVRPSLGDLGKEVADNQHRSLWQAHWLIL